MEVGLTGEGRGWEGPLGRGWSVGRGCEGWAFGAGLRGAGL